MNGYIAFIDILGFSHLVGRHGFEDTWEGFLAIVKASIRRNRPRPQFAIASDSMILTTKRKSKGHLRALLSTVSQIQYRSLTELGLPIRGGITSGNFERNQDKNSGVLVAGRAVVQAYELEQIQDWVGVTLAPQLIEEIPELQDYFDMKPVHTEEEAIERRESGHAEWLGLAIRYWNIPLRGEDELRLTGYVVVPRPHGALGEINLPQALKSYEDKLEEMTPLARDAKAQKKYGGALMFIHKVKTDFDKMSRESRFLDLFLKGT